MLVAITGGSGFIGRRLVLRHHRQKDVVRVLSRRGDKELNFPREVQIIHGDLANNCDALREFIDGANVVYHCAAELRCQHKMAMVNVQGTKHLLQSAAGIINHWVQLSSVGVYGPQRSGSIDEQTPVMPHNIYESTKADADCLVQEMAPRSGFSYTILRPSIVYGPEMSNLSLYHLISAIDRGLFFFVGKPGASANYIHVDNVVEGLLQCATNPLAKNRIYNLSDFRTVEEFVAIIATALGKPVSRFRLPESLVRLMAQVVRILPRSPLTPARVNALTNRARYPDKRLAQSLGYSHKISMEEGLREMVLAYMRIDNNAT